MNRRNPIVELLTDPTKNFLTYFSIGTLVFSIISDGLTTFFWQRFSGLQKQLNIDEGTLHGAIAGLLMLVILLIIYVTPFSRWLRQRMMRVFGTNALPTVQTNFQPMRETFPGLIALVSPERQSPVERVLFHHWNNGQMPH
ncbi:MAG: hypothetical protein AAGA60_30190 [Cyanobacteria bacterium P01_E01_bin.42]